MIVIRIIGLSHCHVGDQGDVCISDATERHIKDRRVTLLGTETGLRRAEKVELLVSLAQGYHRFLRKKAINKHAMHAFCLRVIPAIRIKLSLSLYSRL